MKPIERLEHLVQEREYSPPEIRSRTDELHRRLLADSPTLDAPNFTRVNAADLERMVDGYDDLFFDGLLAEQDERRRLGFRLSSRMTSKGGKTTMRRLRGSPIAEYEVTVSSALLFETFRDDPREIRVVGLPCADRLAATQRIVEHELIHVLEMWLWDRSSCARPRFQGIARRLFGHLDHRHELVTPRERATTLLGITSGRRVAFTFEGLRHEGIVNRVTKRATVLVENPRGERYSNGKRYFKYYIPLEALEPL